MFRSADIQIEGSYYSNIKLISTPNSVARCSHELPADDLAESPAMLPLVQCRQDVVFRMLLSLTSILITGEVFRDLQEKSKEQKKAFIL